MNGSPTQTTRANDAGARSQFAQLTFAAIVVVVPLLASTGSLQYLPHTVLASIVFMIASAMVEVKGMKAILAESPGEFRLAASIKVATKSLARLSTNRVSTQVLATKLIDAEFGAMPTLGRSKTTVRVETSRPLRNTFASSAKVSPDLTGC